MRGVTYGCDSKRRSVIDSPTSPSGTQTEDNDGEDNLCDAESENPEWGGEDTILGIHFVDVKKP